MATIFVCGIVSDGSQALMVRRGDGVWDLPTGQLLSKDESIEQGLARVLEDDFGIRVEEQEFLETYYESHPGSEQPALRNVSLVGSWSGIPTPRRADVTETRWLRLGEIGDLVVDETALRALNDALGLGAGAPDLPGAPILFITGPAAAGKSTVSRATCRLLQRAAHIEVDLLRHMVISGYASPIAGRSDLMETAQQNDLQLANVAALARNFSLAGFHTIVDLVVTSPEELDLYLEPFAGLAPIHLVTLLPSIEVIAQRDRGREAAVQQGLRGAELHRLISENGESRGLSIDSSTQTPEETAAYIVENLERARIL